MKHITESIIGKKGSPNLNIFPIPGIITLKYEKEDTLWDGQDRCDGWYMIADPNRDMFILWSAKASYYPYVYAGGWGTPKWDSSVLDGFDWALLEGDPGIKTPVEMYNIITDDSAFDGYAMGAICNVYVDIPEKIKKLIGKYLGI